MQLVAHKYQQYAIDYVLNNPIAALFLDCGLGKTVITLTAIRELMLDRFDVSRVLIIAPLRVARDTWPEELSKWDHLRGLTYSVAVGTEAERKQAIHANTMLTIINRENVPWLISQKVWKWDMVVLDELSSFKNAKSKRFKALMTRRPKVTRILGLTGTPSPNGLEDLWAEFKILDMGERLGKFVSRFRETYLTPSKIYNGIVYSYTPRPHAMEEVQKKISDITVSMSAVDHLDMPERIEGVIECSMTPVELKKYKALKDDLILIEEDVTASNAASLSGKLSQLANGAIYTDTGDVLEFHDHKLEALEDIIESANGQSVLVAYWFKHDLMRLKKRFPQAREIKTSQDMQDWNARKIEIALCHPASTGHGLNLQQGGHFLVWFGLTWSLELYQQANARLWRQGQTSDRVIIQHIVTKGTIDYQILKALKNKDITQSALIDAVKANL